MGAPALKEANRALLEARWPGLATRVAAAEIPPGHAIAWTAAGEPLLHVGSVALHGADDPRGHARRWAASARARLEAVGAERAVVVGLGLGYHVEALAECFAGGISIVEPDLATWRLALAQRDLSALLARVDVAADGDEPAPHGGAAAGATLAAGRGAVRVLAYAPALLIPGGAHRRARERWQASATLGGPRLRVLVVSPVYGGSWPMAGCAARALEDLGHDVHLLDLSPFHPSLRELGAMRSTAAGRARAEARFCEALGEATVGMVESLRPDVVLALAQAPLGAAALEAIGRLGAVRALWFVEDFRRFTYWREVGRHYDLLLTIQKDECLAALSQVGDAAVEYLPCAFDPAAHRRLALDAEEQAALASPVSFVGAGYRNRRHALRAFLDLGLRIWGSDWEGAGELAEAVQRGGERVSTADSVRIFNATAVNLNLHSSTWVDGVEPLGDFVNPRTFELAGCAAFQVVDRRRLLPELFVPGEELAVADSVAEMKEMARHYLAHPGERAAMAARAEARALAEHTYRHRMQALVATVLRDHEDRLLARARPTTVADVLRRPGHDAPPGLARLRPDTPWRLDDVARDICERSGELTEDEAIFLFLHQFDELYLAEKRP